MYVPCHVTFMLGIDSVEQPSEQAGIWFMINGHGNSVCGLCA